MPNRWKRERARDYYHRQAKEMGYRSRAAYKLKQLNNRFHFLRKADRVLDLGAAPGGWLQVSVESTPSESIIVGVDVNDVSPIETYYFETVIGDVKKFDTLDRIKKDYNEKFNVVLSDMAPNVSGIWELDHYKQIHLARIALLYAKDLLRKDGWFVVKTFQGSEHGKFVSEVKNIFKEVNVVKPKASRRKSAEIYLVAHVIRDNAEFSEEFKEEVQLLK